jgi:preprotein translocase subunit SecG
MAKTPRKSAPARSVTTYLTLSGVAAAFVGALVFFGTGGVDEAGGALQRSAIWAAITFIVVLVGIATLALAVKDDVRDPNKPLLK